MVNHLFIDGVNAYKEYGLTISYGSYSDLACLPKTKGVLANDWHEQNGIDPDLSEMTLAPSEIEIDFYICGDISLYNSLIQRLSDGSYHTFTFNEIGLIRKLRLLKSGAIKTIQNLHKFSLTFVDDNPLDDYTYSPAMSLVTSYNDYKIDGIDVSRYGIRVLDGTLTDIIRQPDVKENLKRNVKSVSGQYYDSRNVTYKSKTVQLKCLMRSTTLNEFWQNRNALIYDLVRPGERLLYVSALNKSIPFYYKSCNVKCFHPDDGHVWFEFTLSVEFFKGVI